MFNLHELKLTQLHREKMEAEANNWRKVWKRNNYQPNPSLKHNRNKRK